MSKWLRKHRVLEKGDEYKSYKITKDLKGGKKRERNGVIIQKGKKV